MPLWAVVVISSGVPTTVFLAILGLIFLPEKRKKLASIIYHTLDQIPFVRRFFKHYKTASETERKINSACSQIEKEAQDIFTHPVSIDWVRNKDEADKYLEKGEGIIKMEYKDDPAGNLINTTLQYLKKSMLPKVRLYLDSSLRTATEYTVAQRVFSGQENDKVLSTFIEEEYEPTKETDPGIEEHFQELYKADQVGIFTRIFLSELKRLEGKLRKEEVLLSGYTSDEVKDFSKKYIATLAEKIRGTFEGEIDLDFNKGQIKVSTMLFIKPSTEELRGLSAHKYWLDRLIKEGYEKIYLVGTNKNALGEFNDRFIGLTRNFANTAEKAGRLRTIREQVFSFQDNDGDRVEAICIETQIPPNASTENSSSKAIKKAFGYEIPEFARSKIDIEEVVRIPDYVVKVAVKTSDEEINPVSVCIGEKGAHARAIASQLNFHESMIIVEWKEDEEEYLVNALRTPDLGQKTKEVIKDIEIKGSNATVYAKDQEAKQSLIGPKGNNVKAASRLTGLYIHITT